MSAEIVILPLALAAALAFRAARNAAETEDVDSDDVYAYRVTTVMTDRRLLDASMRKLGLQPIWEAETARLEHGGWRLGVVHESGRFNLLFERGINQEEALGFSTKIEETYTSLLQAAVITRIQVQAAQSGLEVTSQRRNTDQSVTITLQVNS